MNRSTALVTVAAALGLAACTSAPENAVPPARSSTVPTTSVVTQVVTSTVTNAPPPPAKPVIDSFGFGKLKLGMTRQQALDTGLAGPGDDAGDCTSHQIPGTGGKLYISDAKGVSSIFFTPEMSSDGVGVGATEVTLKAEYTNLKPAAYANGYSATADGNPDAYFVFHVGDGKVTAAVLNVNGQDCHS